MRKLTLVRNTIRNKLMLLLLIAMILPVATSMIISYSSTKKSISEEAYENNTLLLSLAQTNLMNYIQNINQKSLAVYNSINVPRSLYYILEHSMEDEVIPNSISDVINNRNLLKDHLLSIYQSVSEFQQVRLYVVSRQTNYVLISDDNIKQGTSAMDITEASKRAYIEPSHPIHSYGLSFKQSHPDEQVFTLHRPIFRAPSEQLLAILSIDVKLNVLTELTRQLYDPGGENFYIVDSNGQPIISSPEQKEGQIVPAKWLEKIRQNDVNSGYMSWEDDSFKGMVFYNRVTSPIMDWYLIKLTPYKKLYTTADRIAQINTWVGVLFLAVAAIATLYISYRFTKPLLSLIGYVNQIERGNLDVDIEIGSHDEIGLLSRRFKSMMQTINNLILKEYRLEIANKTNQLKALQAQINPHFINNALQSIGTVALQHKDQQVYSLITSLGKMMRYNMNTGETIVELAKEISYIQAYLDLQKQRFDTSLELVIDIDPHTRTILVPKMILQPIVENFFAHGFVPLHDRPAQLCITTMLKESYLIISIQDNGEGMTEEHLVSINQRLQKEDVTQLGQDNGIGLRNVLARLQLQFHESASITLAPADPKGLLVQLLIPLEKEQIMNESVAN